jgi:hypothetical protein
MTFARKARRGTVTALALAVAALAAGCAGGTPASGPASAHPLTATLTMGAGPWMIWRWSGGAPAEITALPPLGASPYYGVGSVAW